MHKKWWILLLIPICLLVTYMLTVYTKPSTITMEERILSIILLSDTKYADGYSDEKFASVYVGMSKDDVYALLGEPLHVTSSHRNDNSYDVILEYSESPSHTHYSSRRVYITDEKVTEIIHTFYLD